METKDEGSVRVAQADEFEWKYVWTAFKDWQIWVNIFVYWGVSYFFDTPPLHIRMV